MERQEPAPFIPRPAEISSRSPLAASGIAEPDVVVVPLGSGGTAVGTALGLRLAGWNRARVVAVRAADLTVTNAGVLRALEAGTTALLSLGGWRPKPAHLGIDRRWFGGAYGRPTPAGDAALHVARDRYGLTLEPTYTAKAFAAALDRVAHDERVVFVQTYGGHALT